MNQSTATVRDDGTEMADPERASRDNRKRECRREYAMTTSVADVMVAALKASGVQRVYGIPGDSLNGFTDALRRDGTVTWQHTRHEEAAAFAAAAEATLTRTLAVCAGSCGPGNLHLINGLYDANRSGVPVWRSRRTSRRRRSAANTSRRRIPSSCSPSAACTASWSASAEQVPRILGIAIRTALVRGGVAVIVIPGEMFLADAPAGVTRCRYGCHARCPAGQRVTRRRRGGAQRGRPRHHPGRSRLRRGARPAHRVRGALQAPVVHAFGGKDVVEYDNPYDVGMTGLIGFSSGYRAMEHCDALVMLGTDFPYRPFYPEALPVVQVDVRGERIGRRVPVRVPLVGTVKDTVDALLPLITTKTDTGHLDRMTGTTGEPGPGWTGWPPTGGTARRCTRSTLPPPSTGSPPTMRSSPSMWVLPASGPPATCG